MIIGGIDTEKETLIVAEIGNNHEGSVQRAKEMVKLAAKAGAQAVKFQTFKTEHYVARADQARFRRLKLFELSQRDFEELQHTAKKENVIFLSTPFDLTSVEFLNGLVPAFKIASGDNTFYPLIRAVAETGKPVMLSSGLANLETIRLAKRVIEEVWRRQGIRQELAVLHCVAAYPVPPEEANLAAIPALQKEFGCVVGYSDHTLGIEAAVMAVTMGARIIEKHFTLDKNFSDFRDHSLSADPADLTELVRRIKESARLLGKAEKCVQKCEEAGLVAMRRSIAANRDLPAGATVRAADITWVRPGSGIAPGAEKKVIGKTLKKNVLAGELILEAFLNP